MPESRSWLSRLAGGGFGLLSVGAIGALVAFGGDSASSPPRATPPPPAVEAGGPDLRGVSTRDRRAIAGYLRWQRLARPPVSSLRSLGAAHPGSKAIYVNRTRAQLSRNGRQRFPYTRGTTIVKTASNGGAVTLIAIMSKVGQASESDGGWRWIEYKRSSGSQPFEPLIASEGLCTGCHVSATNTQRSDWAFYRLR